MAASGKSCASHYVVLKRWAAQDSAVKAENKENSSYDIDEFFALALARSDEKMLSKR